MVRYIYEALGRDGGKVSGRVDAADERSAAAALKDRALYVLRLGVDGGTPRAASSAGGRVPAPQLALFFRELAVMTRAGVTLLQALEVAARQSAHKSLAGVAARLAEEIRAGRSLSQAMARDRRRFPRLAVRLVESAEATGELDPAFERIADIVERRANLRRTLLTSLAYPAFVFVASLGVAIFLVVGIVPKFAAFFLRRNVAMPATTRALLDVSLWVQEYGWYLLALVLVAAGLGVYAWCTRAGRLALDRGVLRLPVVGKLVEVASFSQIAWTLGALLRSGVSLLESLRITAAAVGNRALGRHLAGVGGGLLQGGTLSGGLAHPMVPPIVTSLLAAGERAGAMTDVLDELADFYQNDLELRIRRMSSLVEPVLILVVGGMVGFVYLAFFQALLQLARG